MSATQPHLLEKAVNSGNLVVVAVHPDPDVEHYPLVAGLPGFSIVRTEAILNKSAVATVGMSGLAIVDWNTSSMIPSDLLRGSNHWMVMNWIVMMRRLMVSHVRDTKLLILSVGLPSIYAFKTPESPFYDLFAHGAFWQINPKGNGLLRCEIVKIAASGATPEHYEWKVAD